MGVFENMLLMRETTVAFVMEQHNFSEKINRRNQLLRTLFDRYTIIHPTKRLHDPADTLYINKNQQNISSDAYRAFSRNATT